MKKRFEVGQRVRIYGHKSAPEWAPITGMVIEPPRAAPDGNCKSGMTLAVDCGDAGIFYAHHKQCRRLHPKPRPEKKGPRRVWALREDFENPALAPTVFRSFQGDAREFIEFIELTPDSRLVTREQVRDAVLQADEVAGVVSFLAKGWKHKLYEALGFEADK